MTEQTITTELLAYFKKTTPGVFIKHADRSTLGMPDVTATLSGRTTWIEIKFIRLKAKATGKFTIKTLLEGTHAVLQLELMTRLEHHGRAFYVVFVKSGKQFWTGIFRPGFVRELREGSESFVLQCETNGKNFEYIKQHLEKMK